MIDNNTFRYRGCLIKDGGETVFAKTYGSYLFQDVIKRVSVQKIVYPYVVFPESSMNILLISMIT